MRSHIIFIPIQSLTCKGVCFNLFITVPQTTVENKKMKIEVKVWITSKNIIYYENDCGRKNLQLIHQFLKDRMQEVNLAYPVPEYESVQFMFKLNKAMMNQDNHLCFFKTSYSTLKTFRTIIYKEKEWLITELNDFQHRPGMKNENARTKGLFFSKGYLVLVKDAIKAIANLTNRQFYA